MGWKLRCRWDACAPGFSGFLAVCGEVIRLRSRCRRDACAPGFGEK